MRFMMNETKFSSCEAFLRSSAFLPLAHAHAYYFHPRANMSLRFLLRQRMWYDCVSKHVRISPQIRMMNNAHGSRLHRQPRAPFSSCRVLDLLTLAPHALIVVIQIILFSSHPRRVSSSTSLDTKKLSRFALNLFIHKIHCDPSSSFRLNAPLQASQRTMMNDEKQNQILTPFDGIRSWRRREASKVSQRNCSTPDVGDDDIVQVSTFQRRESWLNHKRYLWWQSKNEKIALKT